jgi:cold shock protein
MEKRYLTVKKNSAIGANLAKTLELTRDHGPNNNDCLCVLTRWGFRSMSTGQVKWFNNAKGFGFILPDGGGSDLFAHYSVITMEGYKTLKAGQAVSFDIIEGPKGLHAINIKPVKAEASADEVKVAPAQHPLG